MSNKKKFQLKSLLQLTQYSYLTEFLKQYHNIVKEEFGQYLGLSKSLICLSKVFDKYENHHEMISELKEFESNAELFTVRKQVISITVITKDGSIVDSQETNSYTSYDEVDTAIKTEFEACCRDFAPDLDELIERFDSLFEDISSFDDTQSLIDAVVASDINHRELINDIGALSFDRVEIEVNEKFLDFKITPSDITHSINNL
jgi:hypothetical protein